MKSKSGTAYVSNLVNDLCSNSKFKSNLALDMTQRLASSTYSRLSAQSWKLLFTGNDGEVVSA